MNLTGKAFGAAIAASIAIAAPAAADATTITVISVTPGAKTNYTKTLTYTVPTVLPVGTVLSVYLSSIQTGPNTDVNFASATLKGTTSAIVKGKVKTTTVYALTALSTVSTGVTELRELLRLPVVAGETFSLAVKSSSQKLGSYTVSFVLGVPEPATWGLMIMGFGAVAYAMRRRVAKTGVLAAA
jgi:hypothetical protein